MAEKKLKIVSNAKIYMDARALLDMMLDITPNFPRQYKYTIGTKMHELSVEILEDIAGAYINRNIDIRVQHLADFQKRFQVLQTLIRIAGERKWINFKRQALIVELADAIGRQSSAWKNSLSEISDKEKAGIG